MKAKCHNMPLIFLDNKANYRRRSEQASGPYKATPSGASLGSSRSTDDVITRAKRESSDEDYSDFDYEQYVKDEKVLPCLVRSS